MRWSELGGEALHRAQQEHRIILINVVATWCHWCHVMEEETYADPEVAALLEQHFVTIRVDSDARPDVAERYRAWGWPATAVLTPDARPVLQLRGYRSPHKFAALLRELIADHQSGSLMQREVVEPTLPVDTDLESLRSFVAEQLDGYYDEASGGWGSVQKYPFPAPVEHALLRSRVRGQERWRDRALATLDGEVHLIDPVWGGMYQYSLRGGWTHPHYEKITAIQAGAISSFAQAAMHTGDQSWLQPARDVARYMTTMMRDPEGGFYTSQDADLRIAGQPTVVGSEYYALGDEGRRRLGTPRIDHAIYADLNGAMIRALVELYAASGDRSYLQHAINAAERGLETHRAPGGGIRHGADDRGLLHLRDQVFMGRALLSLYAATGDHAWLRQATQIGAFMREHLEDASRGGFHAHTEDPNLVGVFAERRKPLEENGLAARFFVELHHYLDVGEAEPSPWLSCARRAVLAVGTPETIRERGRIIGEYLLAIEALTLPHVDVTIVGPADDPQTDALHRAALGHPEPGAVLERSLPGERYPDIGRPAVYLCTDTACSTPITEPSEVASRIDAFASANLR